jgi:hypothetical protein
VTDEGTIRVEGARELRRALKAAGDDLADLKDANQAAAGIVLAEAGTRVPRRSGDLARTGRVNRAAAKANVLYGSAQIPYAAPIHWGWPARNIKAQPWVTDAATASQPAWLQAYADAVQQVVKKLEAST